MTITERAREFFEACETGKGWDVCKEWCHDGATFFCQSDALADTTTIQGYTEWTKVLLMPIINGRYELKAFATDSDRNAVCAYAVFHGTHSGEGRLVAPTGKSVATDYVYVMEFDGDNILHMSKIWDDALALRGAWMALTVPLN